MTSPSQRLYRLIALTQNKWTVVDASEYEWLSQQIKAHPDLYPFTKIEPKPAAEA